MLLSLLKKLTKIVIKFSINSAYARSRGARETRVSSTLTTIALFPWAARGPPASSVLKLLCKPSGQGPARRGGASALCPEPTNPGRHRVTLSSRGRRRGRWRVRVGAGQGAAAPSGRARAPPGGEAPVRGLPAPAQAPREPGFGRLEFRFPRGEGPGAPPARPARRRRPIGAGGHGPGCAPLSPAPTSAWDAPELPQPLRPGRGRGPAPSPREPGRSLPRPPPGRAPGRGGGSGGDPARRPGSRLGRGPERRDDSRARGPPSPRRPPWPPPGPYLAPGRTRAAAGAPGPASRGQGRRPGVERTAARAAPTLPPESGVEHSASAPRANETDSPGNSTTYLRARNGRASPRRRQPGRPAGSSDSPPGPGVGRRSGSPPASPGAPSAPAPWDPGALGGGTCHLPGASSSLCTFTSFFNKLPPSVLSSQSLSTNSTKLGGCFHPCRSS